MKRLLLTSLICGASVLSAQTEGGLGGVLPGPGGPPPGPGGFAGGPHRPGPGMFPGKTVAGAPYTADVTTAVDETLSDGNTIHRVTAGHVARDGAGRTYSQQDTAGGPWGPAGASTITFISDPVAGYTYVLNPQTKTAMRHALKPPTGDRPLPPHPNGAERPARAGERVEENLGTQSINGVNATGKSITRTIPAGAIGNSQPIVEKSELWVSPDLQVVVLSKRSDPRAGVSTYTLSNIRRAEPNPALFQVPSDYTVQDAPRPGRRGKE